MQWSDREADDTGDCGQIIEPSDLRSLGLVGVTPCCYMIEFVVQRSLWCHGQSVVAHGPSGAEPLAAAYGPSGAEPSPLL